MTSHHPAFALSAHWLKLQQGEYIFFSLVFLASNILSAHRECLINVCGGWDINALPVLPGSHGKSFYFQGQSQYQCQPQLIPRQAKVVSSPSVPRAYCTDAYGNTYYLVL